MRYHERQRPGRSRQDTDSAFAPLPHAVVSLQEMARETRDNKVESTLGLRLEVNLEALPAK